MLVNPSSAFVGKPSSSRALRQREEGAVGEVVAVDEKELGVPRGAVVELQLSPVSVFGDISPTLEGGAELTPCPGRGSG